MSTRLNNNAKAIDFELMAVICNTCGLPDDLCACGDLDKDSTHIIIRLETRRFKKKGTMIEGLDPKINNLESVAKELKSKYACGGTAKEGYVFLQGDHRDTIKDTLVQLGFAEDTIELH
jgi:translation initiation factor 1